MRAPSVLVALLAILAVLLTQPSLLVRCQRVRKSWKALSPTEQKAYIGAVQSAQKSGQHYRFVELHATYPNYAFAHGNCGFLMWHRKFLLAYEEMLRSQGDDYANVTIPYWNYFEDHSLHLNQNDKCRNLVECSQFLKDVGGSGGRSDQFTVVAESTSGLVKGTKSVFGQYSCASASGVADAQCQHCLLRGDWTNSQLFLELTNADIGLTLTRIAKNVSEQRSLSPHTVLSDQVESTFHNGVHSKLQGSMGFAVSPFDPIFYSHHAMVDLIHFVHNRCHYRQEDPATREQFDIFDQCQVKQPNGKTVTVKPNQKIPIVYSNNTPVEQDPAVGKYFKRLGDAYNWYINTESLGDYSYSYLLDDNLADLLQEDFVCPLDIFASNRTNATQSTNVTLSSNTSLSGSAASAGSSNSSRHRSLKDEHEPNATALLLNMFMDENVWEKLAAATQMVVAFHECNRELRHSHPELSSFQIHEQLAMLECEVVRLRQGFDFTDYTPEFRAEFRMPDDKHPLCFTLQEAYRAGEIKPLVSKRCKERYKAMAQVDVVDGFGKLFKLADDVVKNLTQGSNASERASDTSHSPRPHHKHHHHHHHHLGHPDPATHEDGTIRVHVSIHSSD